MDENATAALSVVCADYRTSFVPPKLDSDWTDDEGANRGFVAVGLAGGNSLFHGAARILEHLDALCRAASVRELLSLKQHPLLEDLAPRTLGLVTPDSENELVPHLHWLLAAVRGRNRRIRSLWAEQSPDEAFQSAVRVYRRPSPAYVLIRETTGVRVTMTPSQEACEAAQRLGIVSWTDGLLAPDSVPLTLRKVLAEFGDDIAYEALEWFALVTCRTPHEPRCRSCSVAVDCRALADGWF